jgi:hypothetical protein
MSVLLALIATAAAILSETQEEDEHDVLAHRLGVIYDPELPFRIGPVVFDPEHGIGNVPINSNVNYLGFVVWMRPSDYLALNPPLHDDGKDNAYRWILQQVIKGKPIAPPWIDVKIVPDARMEYEADNPARTTGEPTRLKVIGHEGRHRMTIVMDLCGDDVLVPVPVFMPKWRARDLSPHMLLGATIERDRDASRGRDLRIHRLTFNRQNHVARQRTAEEVFPQLEARRPPSPDLSSVPVIEMDEVWHIGSMEKKDKRQRGHSFEGHALSVTDEDHIDDWRRIAKLGGHPLWRLTKSDGTFLDRHAIDDAVLAKWGESRGMLEPVVLHVVSWYSDEEDGEQSLWFVDEEEAVEEAEFMEGAITSTMDGWMALRRLEQAVGQNVDPATALDMVSLLYAEWLGLDGVWWQDNEGEWSAPRGGILPDMLDIWTREQVGDIVPKWTLDADFDIQSHFERWADTESFVLRPKIEWWSVHDLHPDQEYVDEKIVSDYSRRLSDGVPVMPLLVHEDGEIMDGHHRWLAALRLDIDPIPVAVMDYEPDRDEEDEE